ncbi:MAG: hypothetical protein NW201_00850 [Gemmatimonadales bacterium]|nr:hypothetical protein [Gemmatimonadales bacterium]
MAETPTPEQQRALVARWREAGPALQRLRDAELAAMSDADTPAAIDAFAGLDRLALASHPPAPWSGLVEQQRLFQRWRERHGS